MAAQKLAVICNRIYAAVLAMISLILIAGGGWLAALGGSLYYLLAGLALFVTAVLVWRQRRESLWLYAALVVLTILWAIWEVGFDGWALMPRLVAWFVVGAWMLTPWFRRNMQLPSRTSRRVRLLTSPAGLLASIALAVCLGALLHTWQTQPLDPRFQTGIGPFPARRVSNVPAQTGEWLHWGNERGGSRFSTLTQITPANVGGLQLAWTASISDTPAGRAAGLASTPLMVGDTLYTCSSKNEVTALDADTGARRWHTDVAGASGRRCRGVAYYEAPDHSGVCAERILTATGAAKLVALDARTGKLCSDFGNGGMVDLLKGLTPAPQGYYFVTAAPTMVRGKVVIGGWVSDGQYWGEPSGAIRAFDAVTGKLAWAWDMGRPDRTGAPPAGETFTPATPNSWGPMSADEELGLVYLPTGNATPDYFGAQRRPFDDKYSSSVVALDADTGRVRWSFQTTHHDLWDYDVPSQPTLVDLPTPNGTLVPALVQLTKRGEVFVLDRRSGRPIHRVVERKVPQSGAVPEERLSPTQPFSPGLPSFGNTYMREQDMWGITPLDQIYCRIKFRQARYEGTMTPPGLTPWITSPGYTGGSNWGSGSIDPDRGVLILNSTKLATYNVLLTRKHADAIGLRPLGDNAAEEHIGGAVAQKGVPYAASPAPFFSPIGIPCQAPPYGYLSAVDLVTGKLIWSGALGSARNSGPFGIRSGLPFDLGTPNSGGSITTRSGLVFIGATMDNTFRAFDEATGRELWQARLPQGAYATPMTYLSRKSGRQFVVVAAGGARALGDSGSAKLMAYALPN